MAWDEFVRDLDERRADTGLTRQLRELLPETTDDIPFS